MVEQNLQQVTQALQEQNETTEDQSARSAAVIGKLSDDIQKKAKESVEGVKKSAVDTVKNTPKLAMAQLDPVTATVLGQVGNATKSAFKYVQSFGSVIKGKDEEQKEEQNETQNKIEETADDTVNSIENLNDSINDRFEELLAFLQGQSLDELEARREAARAQTEIPALAPQKDEKEKEGEGLLSKLANISEILDTIGPVLLRALTPLAVGIGVVVGIVKGYAKELRLIGRAISGVAKLFGRVFSVRAISGSFTGIVSLFQNTIGRIRSGFTVLSETVSRITKPIAETVKRAKAAGGFVARILGGFARLGSTVGSVAGVVSKLFVPLRFIMVGFETIRGAIQGFKEGGFLGGIQGAVTGFFKALVGVPLDLIKGMVSFVLDKLGFDKAAAFLESFSFSDILKSVVMAPLNLLSKAKDWLLSKFGLDPETVPDPLDIIMDIIKAPFKLLGDLRDWISERVGGLVGKFANFIPGPIKSLLGLNDDDTEGDGESRGVVGTAVGTAKDIGGFVSELFGGDDESKTVESSGRSRRESRNVEVSTGSSPDRVRAGDELQLEGAARREAELSGGANRRANRDGGNVNVSSNVVNNSNTTLQNRPGAASTPDNMSDTMMTAGFAP